MSSQARKTVPEVHLQKHSLRYFRFSPSVPPLKMCVRYTALVHKGNKDIIKVVHVTSVG